MLNPLFKELQTYKVALLKLMRMVIDVIHCAQFHRNNVLILIFTSITEPCMPGINNNLNDAESGKETHTNS